MMGTPLKNALAVHRQLEDELEYQRTRVQRLEDYLAPLKQAKDKVKELEDKIEDNLLGNILVILSNQEIEEEGLGNDK